jgi:hypothetical protein
MKSFGFDKVSLETILDYIEKNDITSSVIKGLSTAHASDFRFSDKYVIKKLLPQEFACFSQMLHPVNEVQRRFAKHLPEVYGLVYDPEADMCMIAMENFTAVDTCSVIEVKVGYYNFLPSHHEGKQQSKIRSAFLMESIDLGYRICMTQRKNLKGEMIENRKIEKVLGIKHPLKPNSLSIGLKLLPEEREAGKLDFLLKAIDYFEGQVRDLHDIFENGITDLQYMITAASLMFMIDFEKETYSLRFIDFGCSFPCSRMEVWKYEQAASLKSILEDIRNTRAGIIEQSKIDEKSQSLEVKTE